MTRLLRRPSTSIRQTNLHLRLRSSALRNHEACQIMLLQCLAIDVSALLPHSHTGDLLCNDHIPNPVPRNLEALQFPIFSTDTGLKPLQIRCP